MSDAQARYKALGLKATNLRDQEQLLHNRLSGKREIVPNSVRELLFDCTEFRSVEDHARRRAQVQRQRLMDGSPSTLRLRLVSSFLRFAQGNDVEVPLQESEVAPIRKELESLVEQGWLTSEEELRAEVDRRSQGVQDYPAPEEGSISALGMTTTEDRIETLESSLESYLQNFVQFGRSPDIIVMDDTPRGSAGEEIRGVLSELSGRYPGAVYYGNRTMRKQAAETIARKANVPESTALFALLGDGRCPLTTGSARNAFSLESAGEMSLLVDDDTFCRLKRAPRYRQGVRLSSQESAASYRFDPSEEGTDVETDVLSIHETLLGRDPRLCVQEAPALHVEDVGWSFLEAVNDGEQRVGYTLMGSRGDSGWRSTSNVHRLRLDKEEAFQKLTEDPGAYRKRLNTRSVLRTVPQYTIGTGSYCIAMQIGLDQRALLPPFMPVGRNSDGIFGTLASISGPRLFSGHLPFTIAHAPPGERQRKVEVDGSGIDTNLLQPRVPDLLQFCISEHEGSLITADRERGLKRLGEILTDIASLDQESFVSRFESLHERQIAGRIRDAKRKLETEKDAIEEWREDVRGYIEAYKQLLHEEDRSVPSDLPGSSGEKWNLFRELVGQFGRLLTHWPALVHAAREQAGEARLIVEVV